MLDVETGERLMRWDPGSTCSSPTSAAGRSTTCSPGSRPRDPHGVVDLGCGPGNLTATLAERWPGARVEGVDSRRR